VKHIKVKFVIEIAQVHRKTYEELTVELTKRDCSNTRFEASLFDAPEN